MTPNTSLLIVGLSSGYLDPTFVPKPVIESRARAMGACADALAFSRTRAYVAAFAPRVYEADGSNIEFMRVERFGAVHKKVGRFPLQRGEPGTLEYPDQIAPLADDIVVERKAFSAFFGTELAPRLKARDVLRLVVVGANTGTCVRATIFDAISHGFRVATLASALSDSSEEATLSVLAFLEKELQIPVLQSTGADWDSF